MSLKRARKVIPIEEEITVDVRVCWDDLEPRTVSHRCGIGTTVAELLVGIGCASAEYALLNSAQEPMFRAERLTRSYTGDATLLCIGPRKFIGVCNPSQPTVWDVASGPPSRLSLALALALGDRPPDLVFMSIGCASENDRIPYDHLARRGNYWPGSRRVSSDSLEQKFPSWLNRLVAQRQDLKVYVILIDPELKLDRTCWELRQKMWPLSPIQLGGFSAEEKRLLQENGWDPDTDPQLGPACLWNHINVKVFIIPERFYSPLWSRVRGAGDVPSSLDSVKWRLFRELLIRNDIALAINIYHDQLLAHPHEQVFCAEAAYWMKMRSELDYNDRLARRNPTNYVLCDHGNRDVKFAFSDSGKLLLSQ